MLTTEAEIRSSIPNGDTLASGVVSALLSASDAAAKSWLRRNIESADFEDRLAAVPNGGKMFLKEYPVQSVQLIATAGTEALDIWNAGAVRASFTVTPTGIVLREFHGGSYVNNTILWADEPTLADVQASIAGLARWDCALGTGVLGTEPSVELAELNGPIDVADSKHKTVYLMDSVIPTDVDFVTGAFSFTECGVARGDTVLARYTAGYSTVPADIAKGVAMLAAEIYKQDSQAAGGNVKREKLGAYEYETHQNQSAIFTPTVMRLLGPHQRRLV